MENTNSSEIFNFVSLRAAQNYDYDKNVVNIIRDNRIQNVFTPDEEARNVDNDTPNLSQSWVGKFLMEKIAEYIPKIPAMEDGVDHEDKFKKIKEYNREIAIEVKRQFLETLYPDVPPEKRPPLSERIDSGRINEMAAVIRKHITAEFDKKDLIRELNLVLHNNDFDGIDFYMKGTVQDYFESPFYRDYYNLFDRLYVLYICQRLFPINLEYVIDGLKALHVLLWLKLELDEVEAIEEGRRGYRLRIFQVAMTLMAKLFQRTPPAVTTGMPHSEAETAEDTGPEQISAVSIITTHHPDTSFRIRTKKDLAKVFNATPFIHPVFAYILYYYKPFNLIKSVGIGDLKVVKQWLCAYEAGEIAHIENVLKGEVRERVHRRLDRTEDILTTETEKIEENEKHLQTTDRYELQNEVDRTLQESFDINNRNNIVYKGTVNVDNTLTVAYNRSREEANKSASNFAKEITSRSVTRIQKRAREERTLRRLFEVEEINKHSFNNQKGSGHVTGIYRFLDKRYKAQVFNYGKRMMFEFVIPEPGAFYLEAFEYLNRKSKLPSGEQEPPPPTPLTEKVGDITEATVTKYNSYYPIDGIKPFPADIPDQDASFIKEKGNSAGGANPADLPDSGKDIVNYSEASEIKISDGGYAEIEVLGQMNVYHRDQGSLTIKLGSIEKTVTTHFVGPSLQDFNIDKGIFSSPGVAYEIISKGVKYFKVEFKVIVKVDNNKTKREWQQDTYDKIQAAYNKAYQNYLTEKAKYDNKKESLEADYGAIPTRGKISRINQQIIKDELQKHSLTILAKQFDSNAADDEIFNAMKSKDVKVGQDANNDKLTYPAIDIDEAKKEGRIVQFLQQAFEWHNIAYVLYPYFWAREQEWFKKIDMYDENLEDPLFGAFLRAGYVRVLVAVRPAYETAVLHYLYTREPWNGGPAPGLYDPLYVPIHEELREQQDDLNNAEPEGEPWEYVLPTNLVYLQESSELPKYNCNPPQTNKK